MTDKTLLSSDSSEKEFDNNWVPDPRPYFFHSEQMRVLQIMGT